MGFVKSNEGKAYALAADLMNKSPHEVFNMHPLEIMVAAKMQAQIYEMQQPEVT